MVALSPASDNFKSACIIAIVAARPLEGVTATPPEVDLFFARPEDIEIDPQLEFIMVEARSGYFEATRHTMKALQKLSTEKFPLASQIVGLNTDIGPPDYIKSASNPNLSVIDPNLLSFDILDDWPAEPPGGLDTSQWSALHHILTKELAIIQGPPGTGKTYVSVAALKVLLANKSQQDPPIVVTAHTNHALDQLLRHLAKFQHNYIRLGGRSADEDIRRRTLYEVRQKMKIPPIKGGLLVTALADQRTTTTRMVKTLEPLITDRDNVAFLNAPIFENLGLLSAKQVESLEKGAARWTNSTDESKDALMLWLDRALIPFHVKYQDGNYGFEEDTESEIDEEYEQLKEIEAEEGGMNDEKEYLRGLFKEVKDSWIVPRGALSSGKAQEYLNNNDDLWSIPQAFRGAVYALLQKAAKTKILQTFRAQVEVYNRLCRDVQIGKYEKDVIILKSTNVIGLTTTGLSKYRALVAAVQPKIVLIEEAAECLEAPIAVACLESLEHLILVGDHQQLQPSTSVSLLARAPFNLHVSMFERLVTNKAPFVTLSKQRRMDPEFRRLLSPIYKNLEDHISVLNRPGPPGCLHKSWFFSHIWPESVDSSFSKRNEREAYMVAAFFNHLVLNGVPVHAITVLVLYNAQRKLILRELRKNSRLAGSYLSVSTADSFQGEENSLVLLSLVRSATDSNKSIGFCGVPNRVCVALSRARLGFYIFGNGSQLYEASPLWREVLKIMVTDQRRVGYHLPLWCKKHGREVQVKDPEDFEKYHGGCDLKCPDSLECGHPCPHKCHPYEHSKIICPMKCERMLRCGHVCEGRCGDASCLCVCDEFARLSVAEEAAGHVTAAKPVKNSVAPSIKPWIDRQKLIASAPARVQRTPSPPKGTQLAVPADESPKRWQKYAAGGVVKDDERRDRAVLELERKKAIIQRQHQQNLMDADYEHVSAKAWKDDGVVSETVTRVDDGNGTYRMRYHQTYVSPHPEVEKHNLDGTASSLASEDLIEL